MELHFSSNITSDFIAHTAFIPQTHIPQIMYTHRSVFNKVLKGIVKFKCCICCIFYSVCSVKLAKFHFAIIQNESLKIQSCQRKKSDNRVNRTKCFGCLASDQAACQGPLAYCWLTYQQVLIYEISSDCSFTKCLKNN